MTEHESPSHPPDDFLPEPNLPTDSAQPYDRSDSSNSSKGLDRFLESIYGSLFTPLATFTHLRSHPFVSGGVCIILLVNALETLRLGQSWRAIPSNAVIGLVGWLFFSVLLRSLALAFQRSIELPVLLTVTAFASTPWFFLGPALSLGKPFGILAALAVMIWFVIWQVWAAAIALDVNRWQFFLLLPLTISGGVVALIWLGNVIKLLLSLSLVS